MKRTLGGQRIGSGNKMEVSMKEYGRSTHDLSKIFRTTMASGTLIPFMHLLIQPGDTIDIDLDAMVLTHPTVGPLFGSYKLQLDVFEVPIRLYQKMLHNSALKVGLDMSKVKLPLWEISAPATDWTKPIDNQQVNPSSILAYLGIRGIGAVPTQGTPTGQLTRRFNAIPYLGYWDIYKNYYANKQEEKGAVIHFVPNTILKTVDSLIVTSTEYPTGQTIDEAPTINYTNISPDSVLVLEYTGTSPAWEKLKIAIVGGTTTLDKLFNNIVHDSLNTKYIFSDPNTITTIYNWAYPEPIDLYNGIPQVYTFPLDNIDEMRDLILAQNKTTPLVIYSGSLEPYNLPTQYLAVGGGGDAYLVMSQLSTQEGLAIKTYQSDIFNNWLKTEWITGTNSINDITKISTAGNSFTVDQLNLANKMYNMLNRIAVSGGTYKDWIETVYTSDSVRTIEIPMYQGGLSKELIFDEVISNSQTEAQPLGTLAGRGKLSEHKHKGGKIVVKPQEWGYLIGLVSLTPRIDYSQGNSWDMRLKTMNDLHKPELDAIGFQDLVTENMAWWDTDLSVSDSPSYRSAGKQPAWIDYMTDFNVALGNFAVPDNEMFMTLQRRYEQDAGNKKIKDLTTYIDPAKFNFIFAETKRDAQNFWTQIKMNITARRVMSAKIMPNL